MKGNIIVPFVPIHPLPSRSVALVLGVVVMLLATAGCTALPTATPAVTGPARAATSTPPRSGPGDTPSMTVALTADNTWQATSPDGQWIAESSMVGPYLEGDQEKYRTRLTVRSRDGRVTWPIIDQIANYGLGYVIPVVLRWSVDGQHLYITHESVPDGCALFVNGSDLLRVDLGNGSVTELVPAVGTSLALSPDETRLAYVGWGADTELVVQPLDGGDSVRVPLATGRDTVQAGNITWSPDGKSLLVTIAFNPCEEGHWTQSVVRIDLAPVAQTVLVDRDARRPDAVSWTDPARAYLHDAAGNDWWLDATTGEVTPVE